MMFFMFTLGFIGTWPKKDGVDSVESAKYDLKFFLVFFSWIRVRIFVVVPNAASGKTILIRILTKGTGYETLTLTHMFSLY